MTILGIESSCDETAAALIECVRGKLRVVTDVVASQVAIHAQYGGVVPEVAARNHMENVVTVLQRALGKRRPDVLAVTAGPGLITSLLVGVQTARTLAYLWKKPLVAVNHIEGHLYANWLENRSVQFPAIVLIVSGGHTELVLMKDHGKYELLGATRDDAAGEAFDKGAKLLGLSYPGGPAISKQALAGDVSAYSFPRPMIDSADYDFSFSGLKTALLYTVMDIKKQKKRLTPQRVSDLCASYQAAIVDVITAKTMRAVEQYHVKFVLCGGGVMANHALRESLSKKLTSLNSSVQLRIPSFKYCTDNAVMIAAAGAFHAMRKDFTPWKKVEARSQWDFTSKS